MRRLTLGCGTFFAVAFSVVALGCGGGRQLQSVTVLPAVADAQNSPGGKVAFAATGKFSKPPSPQPLTSKDVTWCTGSAMGMCAGNVNPVVTIDPDGHAQCAAGFTGTAVILAGKTMPSMNPDGGAQMTIFGSAKLTCP